MVGTMRRSRLVRGSLRCSTIHRSIFCMTCAARRHRQSLSSAAHAAVQAAHAGPAAGGWHGRCALPAHLQAGVGLVHVQQELDELVLLLQVALAAQHRRVGGRARAAAKHVGLGGAQQVQPVLRLAAGAGARNRGRRQRSAWAVAHRRGFGAHLSAAAHAAAAAAACQGQRPQGCCRRPVIHGGWRRGHVESITPPHRLH
jgi:hypothetical protein